MCLNSLLRHIIGTGSDFEVRNWDGLQVEILQPEGSLHNM